MPKSRFAQDAAAMGHTIEQHAAHIFRDGGILPTYQEGGTLVIKRGDTLGKLAKQHGTTVAELAAVNGIEDVNQIVVGQELQLPGAPEAAPVDPFSAQQYIPDFPQRTQSQAPTQGPLAGGTPSPQGQQPFNPMTGLPDYVQQRQQPDVATQGPLVGGVPSRPQRQEFTPEQTQVDATRFAQPLDMQFNAPFEAPPITGKDFRSNKAYKDYEYFEDEQGVLMFKSSPDAAPKRVTSQAALKEYEDHTRSGDIANEILPTIMEAQADPEVETKSVPTEEFLPGDKKNRWVPASVKAYKAYMESAVQVGEGKGDQVKTITQKDINLRERRAFRDIVKVNVTKGKGGKIDYRDYSDDPYIKDAPSSGVALNRIKERGTKEMLKDSRLGLSNFVGNAGTVRTKDGDIIVWDDYNFNPSQNNANLKPGVTPEEFQNLWENSGYVNAQKAKPVEEGAWNLVHYMGEQIKSSVPVQINLGKGKRFLSKEEIDQIPLIDDPKNINHVRYDPFESDAPKKGSGKLGLVKKGKEFIQDPENLRGEPKPQVLHAGFQNGGQIPAYQEGGELTSAQMDSTFNANRDVPFVDRIYNPDPNLQMPIPGGSQSHRMGSYGDYVAPQVVMNQDSTMREVPQDQVGDQVIGAGNAIQMSSPERANFFAKNYKNTDAWKSYQKGMEKKEYGGKLPQYQWGGETFGEGQFARNLGTQQLSERHEDLENLKYLDLPDTDWGALAMNIGGSALSAYGGAGGDFGGALGGIGSADISGLGSSLMGASSGQLAGNNVLGGGYGGFDMAAMGGLGISQYLQQQQGGRFGQGDDGQAAANVAANNTLDQMGQSQLMQAQQLQSQRSGTIQGQQPSPIYAPQYGPRAMEQGGQLGNRELPRLSDPGRNEINLSQEQYDIMSGQLSQEEQEGYQPVYQEGGQLMGYLPEHSFGSWLGDNAGKILKGAGGIISVIPPIGPVVGPILIGAGYATDAIVGAVRKNRAEDELETAQKREEAAAQKRESFAARADSFDPNKNTDYGATFETYQFGGGLMEQKQGQGSAMNPMIVDYNNGQSHDGPQGGIPVDERGNPSTTSNQSAVGLTERGEVAWNGYIFSDKLTT